MFGSLSPITLISQRCIRRQCAPGIGLVYSTSRFAIVASSFLIAFLLDRFGVNSVYALIIGSLAVVVVSVGIVGADSEDELEKKALLTKSGARPQCKQQLVDADDCATLSPRNESHDHAGSPASAPPIDSGRREVLALFV